MHENALRVAFARVTRHVLLVLGVGWGVGNRCTCTADAQRTVCPRVSRAPCAYCDEGTAERLAAFGALANPQPTDRSAHYRKRFSFEKT